MAPIAEARKKIFRGDDEFGRPFPPYLARDNERLPRSRGCGDCRQSSIIKKDQQFQLSRNTMNSKRTVLTITILAALIAVAATWTMCWADETNPATERELNFASVGIAAGQTARLNVSNLGKEPIMAQFFAYDERGVNHLPLGEVPVEPGHSASMDLPYEAAPTTSGRRQIRGMINVAPRSGKTVDGTITDGTIT